MRKETSGFIVLLALALLHPFAVGAEGNLQEQYFDAVSIYIGQGADHNLKELPERIIAGNPKWEKSYLNAIGLSRSRGTLAQSSEVFEDTPLSGIMQGYELVLAKHHGLQDNAEVGAAYTLRATDLWLGNLGIEPGFGIGLSYALGTPSYEDGSAEDPGKRYRLQLLLLFDLEWHVRGLDQWSLVTRVHHRSGVYGLIAPPHVGSNFLAAGVRYRF